MRSKGLNQVQDASGRPGGCRDHIAKKRKPHVTANVIARKDRKHSVPMLGNLKRTTQGGGEEGEGEHV